MKGQSGPLRPCEKKDGQMNRGRAVRMVLAVAVAAMAGTAAYALSGGDDGQQTPSGWNYEIRDGKRVPKAPANRVTNADGSWSETSKQGNCTVVKEKTASGEYKETRSCN